MAAFPQYTIVGAIGNDHCNSPSSGDPTAISQDALDSIKATLLKWFPAGVTITQV